MNTQPTFTRHTAPRSTTTRDRLRQTSVRLSLVAGPLAYLPVETAGDRRP